MVFVPLPSASGVNTKLGISSAVIIWLAVTSVSFSCNVPVVGRLVIVMDAKVSPSMSSKLKSVSANLWLLSSSIVIVLSAATGASLTGVTSMVMVLAV
ncbi:hypothetical protein AFK68_30080 [Hydrocoleum sp. CS-953]|nr:hypothetical protein AFK68_30080 [Hydrocoleum sp. CS-953]